MNGPAARSDTPMGESLIEITDDKVSLGGGIDTEPLITGGESSSSVVAPTASPSHSPEPRPTPARARDTGHEYVLSFGFSVQISASDIAALSPDQIKALFEAVGTVMSLTR